MLFCRTRVSPRTVGHRITAARRRSGTSFVELLIVMSILVFVVGVFYRMLAAGNGMQAVNRENAVAVEAARVIVERIRNENYRNVFTLFNADPKDDPEGEGTAVGARFLVEGLRPLEAAGDGMHGEVFFPAMEVKLAVIEEEPVDLRGEATGEKQAGAGVVAEVKLQLREDVEMPELGMPRDLNGDSVIDSEDHAFDFIVLPVQVRVEWQGRFGPRSVELVTILVDYGRVE